MLYEYYRDLNLYFLHVINGFSGNRTFDTLVVYLSDSKFVNQLILGAPYVYLLLRKPDWTHQKILISGVFSGCLAVLLARMLADVMPFEQRPRFDASSGFHPLSVPFDPDLENWSGFPSDHAALAAGLTLGLFPINQLASISFCVISFIFISLSRIYEGVHYPLDILTGVMLGMMSAVLSIKIVPRILTIGQAKFSENLTYVGFLYCALYIIFFEAIEMFSGVRQLGKLCILLWRLRN